MKIDEDSIKLNFLNFKSTLTLVPIQELLPHEEVNEIHLTELIFILKNDPFLNDPIIADEKSFVVLDGMHRLEALKKLGLKLAPCLLVDYKDERIIAGKWVREAYLRRNFNIGDLFNYIISNIESERILTIKVQEELFSNKELVEILKKNFFILAENVLLYVENIGIEKNIEIIKKLDEKMSVTKYISFEDFCEFKKKYTGLIFFSGRLIEKSEVIDFAKRGKLFPAKTTRHIFPYRVKNLKIPLSLLIEQDIIRARNKFIEWFNNRKFEIKIG